jgi:hypothetical protein
MWRGGRFEMSKSFPSFLLFIALTFLTACDRGRERTNALTGDGQPEVTVMDFSAAFPLDPLPAGWYHRTFWTRGPMQMAFAVKDGVPALRFETRSTAWPHHQLFCRCQGATLKRAGRISGVRRWKRH